MFPPVAVVPSGWPCDRAIHRTAGPLQNALIRADCRIQHRADLRIPNGGSASVLSDLPVTPRDAADQRSALPAADLLPPDWPRGRRRARGAPSMRAIVLIANGQGLADRPRAACGVSGREEELRHLDWRGSPLDRCGCRSDADIRSGSSIPADGGLGSCWHPGPARARGGPQSLIDCGQRLDPPDRPAGELHNRGPAAGGQERQTSQAGVNSDLLQHSRPPRPSARDTSRGRDPRSVQRASLPRRPGVPSRAGS